MKRYLFFALSTLLVSLTALAQNPENDQIRIKIDANVNGEHVKIDTSIESLSDFDIDAFLEDLGIDNELGQLNIDINNGFNYQFNWDEDAFEDMREGLENMEMPAIPAIPAVPDMEFSSLNKALLGVYTDKVPEGAKISEIITGSGAEAAGLQAGDIITKIDDRTIESPSNLSEVIAMYEPNAVVKITFIRDGNTQTVSATLKENESYVDWSKMELPAFDSLNVMLDKAEWEELMKADDRGFLGVYLDDEEAGVRITGIEENSAAGEAGLKEGDVLKEINGNKVASYDDVVKILNETKPGDKITITYERDGKQIKTEATLKENKNTYFYWNSSDGDEEGYAPNIIIDHVGPCPPGSSYSYCSTDGKKTVNVCITTISKSESEKEPKGNSTSTNLNHPLLDPNNLTIYSNPTNGSFNVKFSLPDQGDVKIIITDINGKEVYQETISNFSGDYDKIISLGEEAARGTYFVKVAQGGYSSTKTVVLQ